MVLIKKANLSYFNLWHNNLGFVEDNILLVELGNGSLHFRKCKTGTFCGKDCEDKNIKAVTKEWLTENRDKICKHCLMYIDAAIAKK